MKHPRSVLATIIEYIGLLTVLLGIVGALVANDLPDIARIALAFSSVISGLLLISIGTGLQTLFNIERNTATSAESTKFTADEYRKQLSPPPAAASKTDNPRFSDAEAQYDAYKAAHPTEFWPPDS